MPKVFQIAYSPELMFTREAVLRSRGYVVESALGNEASKKALESGGSYHLFIVGHAAPEPVRQEMVRWVRQKFPNARVLALEKVPDGIGLAHSNRQHARAFAVGQKTLVFSQGTADVMPVILQLCRAEITADDFPELDRAVELTHSGSAEGKGNR